MKAKGADVLGSPYCNRPGLPIRQPLTGSFQSGQAGQFGFSIDTRQGSFGYTLTPSEESRLLTLCSSGDAVSEGERFYTIRPGYQPDPPQDMYRW